MSDEYECDECGFDHYYRQTGCGGIHRRVAKKEVPVKEPIPKETVKMKIALRNDTTRERQVLDLEVDKPIRIGGRDCECDIVLSDPIQACSAMIELDSSGQVSIQRTHTMEVVVNSQALSKSGNRLYLAKNDIIAIGYSNHVVYEGIEAEEPAKAPVLSYYTRLYELHVKLEREEKSKDAAQTLADLVFEACQAAVKLRRKSFDLEDDKLWAKLGVQHSFRDLVTQMAVDLLNAGGLTATNEKTFIHVMWQF